VFEECVVYEEHEEFEECVAYGEHEEFEECVVYEEHEEFEECVAYEEHLVYVVFVERLECEERYQEFVDEKWSKR
jgi:hypothetical protein